MSNLKNGSFRTVLVGAALLLAAVQGCSDDDNSNPKPPDVNTGGTKNEGGDGSKAGSTSKGGKSGSAGTGNKAGSTSEGGTTSTEGGTAPSEAGANDGGAAGAGPKPPVCDKPELGKDGCFNCPVDKKPEQWLNRCYTGDCEPFDNKARLELLKPDGTLPALPN